MYAAKVLKQIPEGRFITLRRECFAEMEKPAKDLFSSFFLFCLCYPRQHRSVILKPREEKCGALVPQHHNIRYHFMLFIDLYWRVLFYNALWEAFKLLTVSSSLLCLRQMYVWCFPPGTAGGPPLNFHKENKITSQQPLNLKIQLAIIRLFEAWKLLFCLYLRGHISKYVDNGNQRLCGCSTF